MFISLSSPFPSDPRTSHTEIALSKLPFFFYHSARHIRRGDTADAFQLYDHTLLTMDTGNAALDAFEGTISDDDGITTLEMTLLTGNEENVVVADTRQADEIGHLLVGDRQRGILAAGEDFEMVVIIGEEGAGLTLHQRCKVVKREMNKDEVGKQRSLDAFAATVDLTFLVMERKVGFYALVLQPVVGFLLTVIRDTENIPANRFVRSVPYRHPSSDRTGERARG